MDADKVCVVSGEPRSGTSLMMDTVRILAGDESIVGSKYPMLEQIDKAIAEAVDDKIRERLVTRRAESMARMSKLNPRGFWELPGAVVRGLTSMEEDYKGKAIKIITRGLYRRALPNGRVVGTDPSLVDKVILCIRNPRHIALSQRDLSGPVAVPDEDNSDQWVPARMPISPLRFLGDMGMFVGWLSEAANWDAMRPKILVVDYEDMHDAPPIAAIAAHLGISTDSRRISAALANVDPLLKRSTEWTGWLPEHAAEGVLADDIYAALKAWDRNAFAAVKGEVDGLVSEQRLEQARWLDEEHTWVTLGPSLWRSILVNENNVRVNLVQSLEHKRQYRLLPSQCVHYSRSTEHSQTIKRPVDLGDLVQPLVVCARDGDEKALQQCKHCWLKGSIVNGKRVPPQREK